MRYRFSSGRSGAPIFGVALAGLVLLVGCLFPEDPVEATCTWQPIYVQVGDSLLVATNVEGDTLYICVSGPVQGP